MTLGPGEARAQLHALGTLLTGARLQEIRQPKPHQLVLSLRVPGRTGHLLLGWDPGAARFHTVERPGPNPPRPLPMQSLLRAELGGELHEAALDEAGQLLTLRFRRGDGRARALRLELDRRGGTIVLSDEQDRVLGAASTRRVRLGDLGRGAPYAPPPASVAPRPPSPPRWEGADVDRSIRAHYTAAVARAEEDATRARLRASLSRRLRSLRGTAAKQRREADRGHRAERIRQDADLLKGSFTRLRRGLSEIEVADWYSEDGAPRRVELDPALTPSQQLERMYSRASKAERAGVAAADRLAATERAIEQGTAFLAQLEQCASLDELLELLAALPRAWAPRTARGKDPSRALLERPPRQQPRPGKASPRLPYRAFRSSSGHEVRVGRGAADNDQLTFRHARGNDVWLHVRGRPGAHVVVRTPGDSPPLELLLEAAQLALAWSGAKPGSREEVSWTRVKNVKKPKGSKPGLVHVSGERVLYVEYDPQRVAALDPVEP